MSENQGQLVLGIDFGSDSVRAVAINAVTGREEANEVAYYKRWAEGRYCNPSRNQFRQHPLDYIEGLETVIKGALAKLPSGAGTRVAGIGIDTTGSTPCPVDRTGMPLALKPEFADNPNAMFILWKDHTAIQEAEEINHLARSWGGTDFTQYEGGVYSSEWFWAKILHVLREDPAIRGAAFSWVEHCDWIPALLTGTAEPLTMKRSRCAAGHKAMWHQDWGGLPNEAFLVKLDPLLKDLRNRLFHDTYTADVNVGGVTPEWAARLGINPGTAVAGGAFDCHMGAVGGNIMEATLVKIMGTSTCDVMVASPEALAGKRVAGICGQVDGSVLPGMIGLEAGQSAYGDVYAWFRRLLSWPLAVVLPEIDIPGGVDKAMTGKIREAIESKLLVKLAEAAEQLDPADTGLIALDWLNGRRTPFADQALKGALIGLNLGSDAPRVYRALVEATAFGAKAIVERFQEEGVAIEQVIAMGGIAKKSDFVMQVTADVLNMPIKVTQSEQACALGAGIFAAVAAGLYPSVAAAQKKMSSGFSKTYEPRPKEAEQYRKLYQKYLQLGQTLADQLRVL